MGEKRWVTQGEAVEKLMIENKKLINQLEATHKSALFWECEYNKEKAKKWYHKLLGI